MKTIKDLDELSICADISSRMALFALAYACDEETINKVMDAIQENLIEVYDEDKVPPLIKLYKEAALTVSKVRKE